MNALQPVKDITAQMRQAEDTIKDLSDARAEAVFRARREGFTHRDIANAMGVTEQISLRCMDDYVRLLDRRGTPIDQISERVGFDRARVLKVLSR